MAEEQGRTRIIDPDVKKVSGEKYIILFNKRTGVEVMSGINGAPDPFVLEMPSMIDIGIMGRCFNKCPMCYQGSVEQDNMKLEHYKKLIYDVKDYVNQVALGGRGDPNHHENFKELIEFTKAHGVAPNYTTSGINMTDQMIEDSKPCGGVAVSDYSKDHTFSAIDRLIKAGIKTNMHKIFSRHSADECIRAIQGEDVWNNMIDLNKLNAVVFLLFKPQGKGKNLLDWIPTEDQIKRFSEAIKDQKCKFKIGMDSCTVCGLKRVGRKFSKMEEMMLDTCEAARMSCYITPDMKLIPCSFSNHEKEGVSLLDTPFKDVWSSGKSFLNFREKLEKNPNSCPLGF